MLPFMAAAARLAAALLFVVPSALAQDPSTIQVAITVADQTGAVIPDAHIGIIPMPASVASSNSWLDYAHHAAEPASSHTDPHGEALLILAEGNYVLSISARGFMRDYEKIEARPDSPQPLHVILKVEWYSGPILVNDAGLGIPTAPVSLNTFIPLEPLQPITLKPRRVRAR